MTLESATKVTELLSEIKELSKYKDLINSREHGKVAHVAFVQHYGTLNNREQVDFDHKYNRLFLPVIEGIIKKLKDELDSL